jgi:chorismate dehydratase
LEEFSISRDALAGDFIASRNCGLGHIDELVEEWSSRIDLPKQVIRTYLTENIHYVLDHECLEGLRTFYRYGADCGALASVPEIHLL